MKNSNLKIRKAVCQDAKAIHDIMLRTAESLDDKSLYVCDDYEFVKRHIDQEGFGLVVCNDVEEIVAGFLFRFPGAAEDNLGRDILLSEEELEKVVHMESVVVLPEYRGNHLQEKMLRYAETLIDKTKYKYLLATVSPDNSASCRSFENYGYQVAITKEKYGGLIRRIYKKSVS